MNLRPSHTPNLTLTAVPAGTRRVLALVLLGFTLLLTAGPALHPLLHADADAHSHECAFVHWAHGEIGFAQSTLATPRPVVTVCELPAVHRTVSARASVRFADSRGPPEV